MKTLSLTVLLMVCLTVSLLRGAQPLEIYVNSLATPSQTFQLGGTNFSTVVQDVVERQGSLVALAGQPFVARFSYLGVPNSVNLTLSATGTSATLDIPSANFTKTFTAANPNELNSKIQNFLRKDGSAQLAKMRRQVNKVSPVGITDGNPDSTTALVAADFFDAMALNTNRLFDDEANYQKKGRLSLISSGGAFNAAAFHGWRVSSRLQLDYRFNPKVNFTALMPFNYVNLEGSTVQGVGAGVGLPVTILGNFEERKPRFTLGPFVGGMFRWSEDLAGGGALVTGGLNSSIVMPVGESWEPAIVMQISDYRGVPFEVDGYKLDKSVDQQILKAGGQLVYKINDRLIAETYGLYNRFLQVAAVQQWGTLGVNLRVRLWDSWMLGGGYDYNSGPDYNSNSGRVTLGVRF